MSSTSSVLSGLTQVQYNLLNEDTPKNSTVPKTREEFTPQSSLQLLDQMQSFEIRAMKVLDSLQSMQADRMSKTREIENAVNQLLSKTEGRTEQLQQMRELLANMSITQKLPESDSSRPLSLMEKTKLIILLIAPPLLSFWSRNLFAGAGHPNSRFLEMIAGTIQLVQLGWYGCTSGNSGLRKFSESAPQQLTWITIASLWYATAMHLDGRLARQ